MRFRITAAVVMSLISGAALADCATGTVSRALLTDTIVEREPGAAISGVNADTASIVAFTELLNAENSVIHHQWYYGEEPAAKVTLNIRGKRWRTWSSKNLGLRRDNNWSVRIMDDSGCELTRLSLVQPAPLTLVDPVLALLAGGDIAGAKVRLAETLDAAPEHAAALNWQLQPAIALAQVEQQLAANNLYIARARLDAISTATSEQARKKSTLAKALDASRERLDGDVALSLSALERVFATRLSPCPLVREQASQQLSQLAEGQLTLLGSEAAISAWSLELLDQRTGTTHALNIACEEPAAD